MSDTFPLLHKIMMAFALLAMVAGCTPVAPPDSVLAVP
ncbi:MAG: D-alanyl-D-alanine carboxypeptidase, partial [Mesorhizobium sp.]